jgi:hypothetical protein
MALKPCRECKKKVSTEATACPNCGAPHPTTKVTKITEPVFTYKFGDVTIENKETNTIKVNQMETFARCNKSFCVKKYQVIKISKSKLGKELCKGCGNLLSKVSEEQAKKYFEDNNRKKNDKELSAINKNIEPEGKYFFNGIESLAVTFWGYFFGGNAVFVILEFMLMKSREEDILTLVGVAHLIWTVLAVMGVFNSADRYKAQKIKSGETYGYATAAKIGVVVIILSSIKRLIF